MTRREFTAKTCDQAHERAGGKCEICGGALRPGHIHYDHRLPCALGGDNSLANCQCLCAACHVAKTADEDVPRIRKADRQRKAHNGARRPKQPIAGDPNALKGPVRSHEGRAPAIGLSEIQRRYLGGI